MYIGGEKECLKILLPIFYVRELYSNMCYAVIKLKPFQKALFNNLEWNKTINILQEILD